MWPFLGKKELVKKINHVNVYKAEKMKGGISLGNYIYISPKLNNNISISHELGHAKDSKLFGPLYLFIIGIPSILNAMFGFTNCYYDFYTEKRANKNAGLIVDNCKLKFKTHETYWKN